MDIINSDFKKASEHHMGGDNVRSSMDGDIIFYDNEVLSSKRIRGSETNPPMRINAAVFFFCRYGEACFNVDYQQYRLTKGTMLILNGRHIIDNIHIPNNYRGYTLILSQDFLMSILEWIPPLKNTIIPSTFDSKPLMTFDEYEQSRLVDIVEHIKKNLNATEHSFRRYIVKTEVTNFLLEVVDIRSKKMKDESKGSNSRKEEVINEFIKLILENCKEQHEVSFYAKKLCITPGSLARIMTTVSGKAPMKWISEALIAEAKILLRNPDMNIQQIADELHFGDQSSFGKFFKKHSGFTPIEYRSHIQEKK
jgi:AraC-type DNA-binding domain-containing proteins